MSDRKKLAAEVLSAVGEYEKSAAFWDSSVLGLTQNAFDRMSEEGKEAQILDSLFRAGDLANAIALAFGDRLDSNAKRVLMKAANDIYKMARSGL